jgi:hypothetical protein
MPTDLELSLYSALQRVLSEIRTATLTFGTEKFVEDTMYDYQMTYGSEGEPE